MTEREERLDGMYGSPPSKLKGAKLPRKFRNQNDYYEFALHHNYKQPRNHHFLDLASSTKGFESKMKLTKH